MVELSAAYNQESQTYYYEFDSNRALGDGYTIDQVWVNGVEIDTPAKDGTFEVPQETAAGSTIALQVQVSADEKLDGNEALKLTVDNQPLNDLSFSATAKIDNFENCTIDGLVTGIEAEGACIDDSNAKVAEFTFVVELSAAYNQESQTYYYEFDSNRALGDGYTIDQVWVNGVEIDTPAKDGTFEVPQETAAGSTIALQVQVSADEKLDGNEALKLTVDNQPLNDLSFSATAKIDNFENCTIDGLVTGIEAEGACIDDSNAKVAEFTFVVELSAAYNQESQTYYYEFDSNRALGDGYTIDQVWVNGVEIDTPAKDGTFEVPQETAAGSTIALQVQVSADEKLDGNEALKLTVDNQPLNDALNERSFKGWLSTVSFNASFPSNFSSALTCTCNAIVEPAAVSCGTSNVPSLAGVSIWVNGVEIDTPAKDGTFEVPQETAAGSTIALQVQVSADEKLDGNEALKLTVDNQPLNDRSFSATAKIDNFENCTIDGLVTGIEAEGACIDDSNAKVAEFTFVVELSAAYNQESQTYYYEFDSNRALGDGYTIDQVWVNGVEIDTPAKDGTFEVPQETAAGSTIALQVQVSADEKLDGNEALKLTVDNQPLNDLSFSATAKIDNFENCTIDGLVTGIEAEGACIDDSNAKVAEFTFVVELSAAYNQESQTYYYEFDSNRALGDGYTIDQVWVNGVEIDTPAKDGTFEVPQATTAGSTIALQVQVSADEKLDGNEALKLTVDNQPLNDALNERSFNGWLSTVSFNASFPSNFSSALTCTCNAIVDPAVVACGTSNVPSLAGVSIWVNGVEIDTPAKDGTFEVPQATTAGSTIALQVQVSADEKLDGNEALKLTVDNQPLNDRSFSATAKIDDFENCTIDGLVTGIEAEGACIDDSNAKVAEFTFVVELSAAYNQESQTYYYEFDSNRALGDGYTIDQVWVNGVEIDTPAKDGTFEVPQATTAGSTIALQVQVSADEKLDGNEALKLTVDNQPDLAIWSFAECDSKD